MNSSNIKVSTKIFIVLIVAMLAILSFSFIPLEKAIAEAVNDSLLLEKCKELTEDKLFTVNNQTKNITQYESYLNDRFQLNNKNFSTTNLEDEWILKIVPVETFKQKKEFFYIGNSYGFYINYDNSAQTYLVYILLNQFEYNEGLLSREIKPLYYEQYVFNEQTEKVSLVYMEYTVYPDPQNLPFYKIDYYHYRKHSNYEKLYLKDVNFTGNLYNENQLNIDESDYNSYQDNGGYFVESRYRFKGVSTQSGKFDFADAMLQIGLGYIPYVGDLMNILTLISELKNFANNAVNDFRGTVSNEEIYKNDTFSGMYRDKQICRYGVPLKVSATKFQTNNTKEAVLLGINSDNYARNEYLINYYDQSDMWNTRYVGNVSLDIVKEVSSMDGSTVTEIANDISAVTPCSYTINNGEETKISESEEGQLYILNNARHRVSFTAPENGIYTINTFGEIKNNIICQLGEVTSTNDGVNKKLLVTLKKGQNIKVDVTKDEYMGSEFIGIFIRFTPEEIIKGDTKEMTIAPNQREFFGFNSKEGVNAFDFNILSQNMISLEIFHTRLYNSKYYITGLNLVGSMITNSEKYFIGIQNNTAENITIIVSINAVEEIEPTSLIDLDVLDKKVLILSAPFSAGISINVDSQAPIYMKLYDEYNNLINLTTSSDEAVIMQHVEKNKKYFVLLENYSNVNSNVNISVSWAAFALALGNNNLDEAKVDDMYVYKNMQLDAQFNVSTNSSCIVYDKKFNVLTEDSDGCYTFYSQEIYYFVTQSYKENCTISIDLNYTEATSGAYSLNGSKFIKYVPNRTSVYKVDGATNYSWFSEGLQSCGAYLYAGNTYYLRIEGIPSQQYDISIIMNRNQVPIGRVTNLLSGYYYFSIEEAGVYSFRTYCSNDISSTVSIYDGNGEVLANEGLSCKNLNTDANAYEINLGKGLYYIDLDVNSSTTRVGLQINKK